MDIRHLDDFPSPGEIKEALLSAKKTISNLKSADGLVVGSAICREISRSINNGQNPFLALITLILKFIFNINRIKK